VGRDVHWSKLVVRTRVPAWVVSAMAMANDVDERGAGGDLMMAQGPQIEAWMAFGGRVEVHRWLPQADPG